MISPSTALLRLGKERHSWRKNGDSDYVKGVLRGLALASRIIEQVSQEGRDKRGSERFKKWDAPRLSRCIRQSFNYLNRGDRAKAIERLRKEVATLTQERTPNETNKRSGI